MPDLTRMTFYSLTKPPLKRLQQVYGGSGPPADSPLQVWDGAAWVAGSAPSTS